MKKIFVFLSIFLILASCAPSNPATSIPQPGPTVSPTADQPATSTPTEPATATTSVTSTATTTATVEITSTPTPQTGSSGKVPNFDHIVLILLENQDYANVIGSPHMPHLNELAQKNVLLSNYFAVRHPSLPNYIALMSGSTQNITSDCIDCFVNQPSLADRIEASGRTWKSYLESMPSPCFIGDADPYVQKHDPLIYFDSIRLNAARCERSIVPLTSLDSDLTANQLPNFSFIMPNICNSGHNCSLETADTWVNDMVTKLQASPALGKDSLIIIAFDEGNEKSTGSCCGLGTKAGGQVAAVLISPLARQGFSDNTAYSHYSLLKMILSAWNLPDLGESASAPQILAPWDVELGSTTGSPSTPSASTGCVSSSPSPGAYTVTVCFSGPASGAALVGDNTVTATVSATGTNLGTQRMIFYLDGIYLLTDYGTPYTFILPTTKWMDGSHSISVEALMRDGFTSKQASLAVSFKNGITTLPVNTNQFKPSSGTTPANGAPFIVAAGGDGASGETNAGKVSNLIASLNPNLFLYLGDVYEKGSTAEFYNWFGTSATNFGRFRSITDPTVGNHEYTSSSTALGYFDYWNNIPNYYSFNAGGWHFISLNSNSSFLPVGTKSAQYLWLQQDLAANAGACTIVYYHHPLFNIGSEGSTTSMTDTWKLMAQYGVAMVLNGHDHDYQRWVPLDGSGQPSPNGITEIVAGGAGHGLQTFKTSDSRVAYSNDSNPAVFGILLLQLNKTSANFSYRSTNGSTLDSGVIPCQPITPVATPTATSVPTPTNTPTPTVTASQTLTFTPAADTYVNADGTGTYYGTSTTLRADASPDVHSYLRFTVLGLGGKTILRARLLIYANSSLAQGISALAVADNTWDELTTNYTNAPTLGNTLATSDAITTGSWVTLDVTSYITGEGTFSFGVNTASSTAISLASRESGANAPQLIIDLK